MHGETETEGKEREGRVKRGKKEGKHPTLQSINFLSEEASLTRVTIYVYMANTTSTTIAYLSAKTQQRPNSFCYLRA